MRTPRRRSRRGVAWFYIVLLVLLIYYLMTGPRIEAVSVDPPQPAPGEPVTIRWDTISASQVRLTPGFEDFDGPASRRAYTIQQGLIGAETITVTAYNHWFFGIRRAAETQVLVPVAAARDAASLEQTAADICVPPQPANSAAPRTGATLPLMADPRDDGSEPPYFAQNSSLWAELEYNHHLFYPERDRVCGATLSECGCALTSVATVLALFQVLVTPDGSELNPKSLNDWFNGSATLTSGGYVTRGYVYGNVRWDAVNSLSAQVSGAPQVSFRGWGSGSPEEIRRELREGRPVVLDVGRHYVAAVGLDGETILINDPFFRDRTTLDAYRGRVRSSRLFSVGADAQPRAVTITVPGNARVQVTDSAGRVTGTLATGPASEVQRAATQDIPGSGYHFDEAWRDPSCAGRPPPPDAGVNVIYIRDPGQESFEVIVVAVNGTSTEVIIHETDEDGHDTLRPPVIVGNNRPLTVTLEPPSSNDPGAGNRAATTTPIPTFTSVPPLPPPPTFTPAPTEQAPPTFTPAPTLAPPPTFTAVPTQPPPPTITAAPVVPAVRPTFTPAPVTIPPG